MREQYTAKYPNSVKQYYAGSSRNCFFTSLCILSLPCWLWLFWHVGFKVKKGVHWSNWILSCWLNTAYWHTFYCLL